MKTGPARAACSRWANDHSDQLGSSVTRSSNTLLSTKVTSALAARHGHDLIGTQTLSGVAAHPGEAIGTGLLVNLHQNDSTIFTALEIDPASCPDSQKVTDSLGNGDLTFAGNRRAHGGLRVRRYFCFAL